MILLGDILIRFDQVIVPPWAVKVAR